MQWILVLRTLNGSADGKSIAALLRWLRLMARLRRATCAS